MVKKIKRTFSNIYLNVYSYFIYRGESKKWDLREIRKILFVCKGNVCRSPMAEFISRKIAKDYDIRDIEFYSRGLDVSIKSPVEKEVSLVCKNNGIKLSSHESNQIDDEIVKEADLIFVMEYSQLKQLAYQYPLFKNKILLLPLFLEKFFAGQESILIKDPYGCSIDDFEKCYQHILKSVSNLLNEIKILRSHKDNKAMIE